MSPTSYRFLASPRWLGLIVGGLAAMVLCAYLANWQYGRYEDRALANDRAEAALDSEPRPLSEVLPEGGKLAKENQWTRTYATGAYDATKQIFLRGRTVNGNTGWEVVVPLILSDGTAVLVDRGWVEQGDKGATITPDVPAPPVGEVTVNGRVRPAETARGEVTVTNGVLQARRLNPSQLASQLPYPVLDGYVTPDEPEDGFAAIPVSIERERTWQNYAYAYQWWLFAGLIPIGLVVLARKERRGDKPRPKTGDRVDGAESVPSRA